MRRRRLLAYGIPAAAVLVAALTWNGAGGRARRSVAEGFARFRRSSSPSVRLYDLATGVAMGGLYAKIADDLVREIGAAERILDIGCGPGRLLVELARRFPDARLTGVDLDPAMLAAARERLMAEGLDDRVELLVADAVSLPLPDDAFDLVTSSFSLHHWGDPASGPGRGAPGARAARPRLSLRRPRLVRAAGGGRLHRPRGPDGAVRATAARRVPVAGTGSALRGETRAARVGRSGPLPGLLARE